MQYRVYPENSGGCYMDLAEFSQFQAARDSAFGFSSEEQVAAFVTRDGELIGGFYANAEDQDDWADGPKDIAAFAELLAGKS